MVLADTALGALVAALSVVAFFCEAELVDAPVLTELVEVPASDVVAAVFTVLPENDWAATADSAPVTVTLPAISSRFTRVSLRSAASLDFTSVILAMGSVSAAWLRRV